MDAISLTALVFAVVAFLVALAQALLQYLTSDTREKVMSGALGGWSRFSKTSWNYRSWRINVKYADLDLNANGVLDAMQHSSMAGIHGWMLRNGVNGQTVTLDDKQWKDLSWWDLWAEHTMITKKRSKKKAEGRRPMNWKDLTWMQALSWLVFLFKLGRHRRPRVARAGWANLLSLFTIQASKTLLHRLNPADHIPGAVDVPFQMIDLRELALLCYVLNMKRINISLTENTINAKSTYVRLSTLDIPGLGQVVTFDGDIDGLRKHISRAGSSTLRTTLLIADGSIYYGNFAIHPNLHQGHKILLAMRQGWDSATWEQYQFHITQENVTRGIYRVLPDSLRLQAQEFHDNFTPANMTWEEFWQRDPIRRMSPNLITTMAFQQFHSIWSGMPLQNIVTAYGKHFQEKRTAWLDGILQGRAAAADTVSLRLEPSLELDTHMMKRSIPWLLEESDFLLATEDGADWEGLRTWTLHPTRPLVEYWDLDWADRICDTRQPLHLPSRVYTLLQSGDVEACRKDLSDAHIYNAAGFGYYTIEAALYLSLIIVDCRIQSEWCKCESVGPLSVFYGSSREKGPKPNLVRLASHILQDGPGTSGVHLRVPSMQFISAELADFLALWLAICERVDPLDTKEAVQSTFDVILDEWKEDANLCVPMVPEDNPVAKLPERSNSGSPQTRASFYKWIEESERVVILRELLPLLQLRTFLLHLSFLCHSDSSEVSNIGGLDRGKLRLI